MKRILFLSMLLTTALLSCERGTPEAHFYTDTVSPEVGRDVYFTNDSRNAVEFEWDFGDGYVSYDANPVHYFTATGSYDVILTVYSKKGLSDQAAITIDVKVPTLLEIEVLEYYEEYVVPGASVILYPSLIDWESETNYEAEGFTDNDGIVVFSHLGPYIYYVDVWETDHDNYALKEEGLQYIRTDEIMPNKINRFIAWVDIVDHGKGEGRREKSYVIRKIERKVSEKPQADQAESSDDWKSLYERSIKLK